MANPILDQIMAAVTTAVTSITTANGYSTNIEHVYRYLRSIDTTRQATYACVVTQTRTPLRKSFVGLTHERARVSVYVYTRRSADAVAPDQVLHKAESDVRKAIAAASALTPGESAIVDRPDWAGSEYETALDDHRVIGGVRVDFDLQYAVLTADPTISRSTP